jgi:hypothetical protein
LMLRCKHYWNHLRRFLIVWLMDDGMMFTRLFVRDNHGCLLDHYPCSFISLMLVWYRCVLFLFLLVIKRLFLDLHMTLFLVSSIVCLGKMGRVNRLLRMDWWGIRVIP